MPNKAQSTHSGDLVVSDLMGAPQILGPADDDPFETDLDDAIVVRESPSREMQGEKC